MKVELIEQNGQYRFDFVKNKEVKDCILLLKDEVLQMKELMKNIN